MAKKSTEAAEVEPVMNTYEILKNFIFKTRVYTRASKGKSLGQFTDADAARISKLAPGAIKLHEGK